MALIKLLRRQNSATNCNNSSFKSYLSSSRNPDGRFVLEKDDVRLVIFRDHRRFGRKLLYDSHRCNAKDPGDKQLLGELMFGNQVMVKKCTSTIKVHLLRSPLKLIIAKVFSPCSSSSSGNVCLRTSEMFDWYCFQDLPQNDLLASSNSLPVPLRDDLNKSYDTCNAESHESYKSTYAKWLQMKSNDESIENAFTSSFVFPSARKTEDNLEMQCLNDTFCSQSLPPNQSLTKIGIGIIFLIPENDFAAEFMRKFFFSHTVILESYISKLQNVLESPEFLEKLKQCRPDLLQSLFEETMGGIIQTLQNFYSFPRLTIPVWMTLSSSQINISPTLTSYVTSSFMRDFVFLSDKCYTRNTKFFLGSLLTAVLTHHLSWASSMSPKSDPIQPTLPRCSLSTNRYSNNVLLAQIRDLYGAVGFPCCISKTVVVGKRTDIVKRFLYILTYFIRCNDLLEASQLYNQAFIKEISLSSFAADSEFSKDSGFCESESEDVKMLIANNRAKFKGLEKIFDGSSQKILKNSKDQNVFCSHYGCDESDGDVSHSTSCQNEDVKCTQIGIGKSVKACSSLLNHYEDANILLKTDLNKSCFQFSPSSSFKSYQGDDFQSIIPSPNGVYPKCTIGQYHSQFEENFSNSTFHTCKIAGDEPSDSRENSQLQKEASPGKLSYECKRFIISDSCNPEENIHLPYKFNIEETLYEIMFDIYKDDYLNKPSLKLEDSLCYFDPISRSSFPEDCVTNYSDLQNDCILDVNEPTCLLDGPIKDQLLFKLDLIGTANSVDEDAKEECFAADSDMRQCETFKKLVHVPLMHDCDDESIQLNEYLTAHSCQPIKTQKLLLDDSNLGRSLLGGYCTGFTPEFVLHGTSDRSFLTPPYATLHQELKTSLKSPVLSEHADAALYIVADTDNWTVQLFSLKSHSPDKQLNPQTIISSQLVLRLIESTFELSKFDSSSHIWLNLVEDQLTNIYMKSRVLAEFIQIHGQLCSQQLARLLGYDVSDLPLLLAVAGIHSPRILPSLANPQGSY